MVDLTTKQRRVGVLGGTFDPIHIGHLMMAEAVRCEYALDEVLFVPAKIPPHKLRQHVAPAADRLAMVRLAVADNPFFRVSTIEMERPGLSYTIDTVRALREVYADAALFFLVGTDVIWDMVNWERINELLGLCEFIAAQRPGCQPDLSAVIATFGEVGRRHIHPLATPELEISSTDIRERVRKGHSIRYVVPDAVAAYINEHRLYQ